MVLVAPARRQKAYPSKPIDRQQDKEIRSLKREVRKLYKSKELKYFDTATNSPVSTAGRYDYMCNVAPGDSPIDRDGAKINIVKIQVKGYWKIDSAATKTVCRVMLVEDTEPESAITTPPSDGINAVLDTNLAGTVDVNAFRNVGFEKYRFRVHYDKTLTLSQNGPQTLPFEFNKKVNKNLTLEDSDPNQNPVSGSAFYLLTLSDEATNAPDVVFNTRIRFYG